MDQFTDNLLILLTLWGSENFYNEILQSANGNENSQNFSGSGNGFVPPDDNSVSGRVFYHGTDVNSVVDLANGVKLDEIRATGAKIDGPVGFFLATSLYDAEYFAIRRFGGILQYNMTDEAYQELVKAGAYQQKIPAGIGDIDFVGDEFVIPTDAFDVFNELQEANQIKLRPFLKQHP